MASMLIVWLACLSVTLAGCAATAENDCRKADWYGIGYKDGALGYPPSRFDIRRKACAGRGIGPDVNAYEAGRRKGLHEWCTPGNGYRAGMEGRRYNGVCPEDLEPSYRRALDRGRAVRAYHEQINRQSQALKRMYADLEELERAIDEMKAQITGETVSPRQRKALLRAVGKREEERSLLLKIIAGAEAAIADMRLNLRQMRERNPFD